MDPTRIVFLHARQPGPLPFSCDALNDQSRGVSSEGDSDNDHGIQFDFIEESLHEVPAIEYRRRLPEIMRARRPKLWLAFIAQGSLDQAEHLLTAARELDPAPPLVALAEGQDLSVLQRLIRWGADDVLTLPCKPQEMALRLWRLSSHDLGERPDVRYLKEKLGLAQFVGESPGLVRELERIPRMARCDASVLIQGETGTGKELVARAIHYLSPRTAKPFIPVNCGALPVELIENELFGHDQGAYTSAAKSSPGLIREADGGTLFLDEIDAMPLAAQVKLLRFLQEMEFRPLGSSRVIRADLRLIAASNAPLEEAVAAGRFRQDLFYRLNVLPITLPPLRERPIDVPLLARHFLRKYAAKFDRPARDLTPTSLLKLQRHDWPGNVRELENVMEQAVVMSETFVLRPEDIPLSRGRAHAPAGKSFQSLKAQAVAKFERGYIVELLAACEGNITQAARLAKKNRRAFWELMRKHRIQGQT